MRGGREGRGEERKEGEGGGKGETRGKQRRGGRGREKRKNERKLSKWTSKGAQDIGQCTCGSP